MARSGPPGETFGNGERHPHDYAQEDEEEAEQDLSAPSRWYLASTVFPLLAATFCPVASVFSICALSSPWRIKVIKNDSAEIEGPSIADPAWLSAVNAVSLLLAVLANGALLANMANRLSFAVTQAFVLAGFYFASFLLIGLVAATPRYLQTAQDTLSQAFYYACIAAGLYFVVASMLLTTSYGAYIGKYTHKYKLTTGQRTLMIQVILFLGYLLCSAVVFSHIENWPYLDAVYWSNVTLFTIGYGDFSPRTHLGRSLFIPYAVGGILFVGLIVGSITSLVVSPTASKVTRRNVEKARQAVLRNMDSSGNVRAGLKKRNIKASSSPSAFEESEHQFNLMRAIQAKAAFSNALLGLGSILLLFITIWCIGSVVFWQAQQYAVGSETGNGVSWSYFEALYFTYVSFLTIGYGDFYPVTPSSKPSFLLWSLIALPTLTVLIGSLGGAITTGINVVTLWIANHLPAKTKSLRNMKSAAEKVKKGDNGGFTEAKPPGFEVSNGKAGQGGQEGASIDSPFQPLLRIQQLRTVIGHLNASPPRKYTFDEWTWILKLLGEEQGKPQSHTSDNLADKKKRWSWLDRESPLISGMDEPNWVLDKLIDCLELELKQLGEARRTNGNP